MKALAVLAILAITLAGCTDGGEPADDTIKAPPVDPSLPPLHGWILGDNGEVLTGADVTLLQTGEVQLADARGRYEFVAPPMDEPIVLVTSMDGFQTLSKQVTLVVGVPVRLNFTLEMIPEQIPYATVSPFNGFLPCQVVAVQQDQQAGFDCSGGSSEDTFDLQTDPELAGAVFEIFWDAETPLSASFHAVLETLGAGDQNTILDEQLGQSPLRLQVNEAQAAKYFAAGGKMRLTVEVLPNVDEDETGVGAGLAINEEFQAFASLFYIEGPAPTYTVDP